MAINDEIEEGIEDLKLLRKRGVVLVFKPINIYISK